MTSQHRGSYAKTSVFALGVAGGPIVAAYLLAPESGFIRFAIIGLAWAAGAFWLCVAAGGAVALYRDGRPQSRIDLFRALNERRSERLLVQGVVDGGLRWRRRLGLRRLVVGDVVEIRSYEEIRRTLDADGGVDGLPFLPEMKRFCGQRARVFRCVDKIYDYGRTKELRRLDDAYALAGLRCDGSGHGGCQAGCYLIWKSAWFKRVATVDRTRSPASSSQDALSAASQSADQATASGAGPQTEYRCQFTQLAGASTPMKSWDIRQDLRPLWAGNITFAAFLVAVLTRAFNYVQHLRGGTGYPAFERSNLTTTPAVTHGLQAGAQVRVCSAEEIARTLDGTGRNRGLWFDRDMLKHCGKTFRVFKRIDRIIDDATGRMRVMKSPCIVLGDVNYSGEFLRFCAQEEYLYWREAWLTPLDAVRGAAAAPQSDAAESS